MISGTDPKTGDVLTREDASAMAIQLLRLGMHPQVVRLRLAERGIRWTYHLIGQGQKERLRRLRQQGLGLCPICKREGYELSSDLHICQTCLRRKWEMAEQVGPAALDGPALAQGTILDPSGSPLS